MSCLWITAFFTGSSYVLRLSLVWAVLLRLNPVCFNQVSWKGISHLDLSKVQLQDIWLLWICYKFWKFSDNPRKWHIFNRINWISIVRFLSFWKEGAIFIPRRSNDIIFSLFNVLSIFNLQKELFQITTRFICILKILLVIFKN